MPKPVKTPRTRVVATTCNGCKQELFSRARHDFRSCKCGKTSVDGGYDYNKVGFDPNVGFTQRHRYVKATRQELYDDWNKRTDKFGILSPPVPEKDALPKKRPSRSDKQTEGWCNVIRKLPRRQ